MSQLVSVVTDGIQDALRSRNLRYFGYAILLFMVVMVGLYYALFSVTMELLAGFQSDAGWISRVAGLLVHAMVGVLGYFLLAPLILITVSLFSEQVVNNIRRERYPSLQWTEGASIYASIGELLQVLLKYVLLMLLVTPLTLLLGLGYLLYFFLGYLLFRRLLLIDVLGLQMPIQAVRARSALGEGGAHRGSIFLLYLLTLVPVVGLFVPYVALCVVANESMSAAVASHRHGSC